MHQSLYLDAIYIHIPQFALGKRLLVERTTK